MLRVATYGKPAPHSFYDVTNTWLIQCRVTNVAPAHRMFATRNEIEFAAGDWLTIPYWKCKFEKLGCLFRFKCESRTCASHDTAPLTRSAA